MNERLGATLIILGFWAITIGFLALASGVEDE